jgi:hypothetical protein
LLCVLLVGVVLAAAAIALGIHFGGAHHKTTSNNAASPSSGPGATGAPSPSASASPGTLSGIYGGNGTVVTTEKGTTFTYINNFGGYFVQDPENPFNNGARAQSWSPPLNQSWEWGKDQVLG